MIRASNKTKFEVKGFRLFVFGINNYGVDPHTLRELYGQAQSEHQQVLTDAFALMPHIYRQTPDTQYWGRITR